MGGSSWLRQAADLVLPVRCVGCGVRATAWCPPCQREALDLRVRELDGGLQVVAASSYDGAVREALLGYKERGRRDLTAALGRLLAASVTAAEHGLHDPVVIPMPSSSRAVRQRGGDHMLHLVRRTLPERGVATALGSRAQRDAAELSATGRQRARRTAMYARRGTQQLVAGRDVLLVDDIVTTGATLARAGEIVIALGARGVRAAVVAETERQVAGR